MSNTTEIVGEKRKRAYNVTSGTFIVEKCHEPIIDPKDLESRSAAYYKQMAHSRRGYKKYNNIFSGLLKCDTCERSLTPTHANRRNKPEFIDNYAYQRNLYRLKGKEYCTHHWLEARDLHEAILSDIKRIANETIKNDKNARKYQQKIS